MGILRSIAYFLDVWKDFYEPDNDDFADLFTSFAHRTRDFDQMGGGLKKHNINKAYKADEAAIYAGKIWVSDIDQQGPFSEETWHVFDENVDQIGIARYDYDKTDYVEGNQMIYKGEIWRAIWQDGEFGGVAPDDAEGEDYWEAEVFTDGGKIPLYRSGWVKEDRVYSYQGNLAPKGFYRCVRSDPGFDGGFKSTNFVTELGDGVSGDWKMEAGLNGESGNLNASDINDDSSFDQGSVRDALDWIYAALYTKPAFSLSDQKPDNTFDQVLGYQTWSVVRDFVSKLEWECTNNAAGAAVWVPTSNLVRFRVALSSANLLAGGYFDITDLVMPPAGYAWVIVDGYVTIHSNTAVYVSGVIGIGHSGAGNLQFGISGIFNVDHLITSMMVPTIPENPTEADSISEASIPKIYVSSFSSGNGSVVVNGSARLIKI